MSRSDIPSGVAERIAQDALARIGRVFPTDLHALAEVLGVDSISISDELVGDGLVEWDSVGIPRVSLAAGSPPTRQRFTLAHELGHVLLEGAPGAQRFRQPNLDPSAEETLCDRIAAGLLMPRPWIDRYAKRDHLNLSILRLVAHRADVSLSAAAVRLSQVGSRTCALLRWKRSEAGTWILLGRAGVPPTLGVPVTMPIESTAAIDSLRSHDVWVDLDLRFGGENRRVHAHASRQGERCVMLVTDFTSVEQLH